MSHTRMSQRRLAATGGLSVASALVSSCGLNLASSVEELVSKQILLSHSFCFVVFGFWAFQKLVLCFCLTCCSVCVACGVFHYLMFICIGIAVDTVPTTFLSAS